MDFAAGADVGVLIVGAGLSGIGMACHLRTSLPDVSFAIVEARDTIGGTWDLFRYPGVRSDSDMYTLGYRFRPWPEATALADGEAILRYIRDTAEAYRVTDRITFGKRVVAADWSTAEYRWTVRLADVHTGEESETTARFLFAATGYYDYDAGYTPDFAGRDDFRGQVVHPQEWPADLDYAGRRIVVIGSGATAVTLVPALAETAGGVTMVQRTPTYIAALPRNNRIDHLLQRLLPSTVAYKAIRRKHILGSTVSYQLARRAPSVMKAMLRSGARAHLPTGYPVDEHFAPPYNPWDQRLCLAPDGDFYAAIAAGRARVVTDTIDRFTATGVRLASGLEVPADTIVTATGLNIEVLGGMSLSIDSQPLAASEAIGFKGAMFCGIPNFAVALGYTNASWTLKCDLIAEFTCRVIRYLSDHSYHSATPRRPPPELPTRPFMDLDSGYLRRAADRLPRQVDRRPWRLHQNYLRDLREFRSVDLAEAGLDFA